MNFLLGFLSAILMLCIFSAAVHFFRWIEQTFSSTINPVETKTDDYSLTKARRKVTNAKN